MEDDKLREFVKESKNYKKILSHRRSCKKWGKEFCIKCFGGGLVNFVVNCNQEFNDARKEKRT